MTNRVNRRHFLQGAAALGAAGTFAPFSSVAFERDGNRKILVFTGNQAVPVLDPHWRYDWSTRMIQQSVYDGLLKYVGTPPKIIPWLAEKYEMSPDGKTYTFTLVGNAKFHNGDPVDAEEPAHRDQNRSACTGQNVGGLLGRVAGVDRHHHTARVVDCQAGDDPVPGVR